MTKEEFYKETRTLLDKAFSKKANKERLVLGQLIQVYVDSYKEEELFDK